MSVPQLHEPVLKNEVIEALSIKAGGTYIDATFGRGGHTKSILNSLGFDGRVVALDRDPEALAYALKLQNCDSRLLVAHTNFGQISTIPHTADLLNSTDGILFDLGVSSPQLSDSTVSYTHLTLPTIDLI